MSIEVQWNGIIITYPGNSSTGVRRADNSLLPEETNLREAVDAARRRGMVFNRTIN
jgi:hypothetical protein